MTRRDKLQENYEDALFALLMDEVVEREGQRYLDENERLKKDPDSAVPEELDRRCLKLIRQTFAKDRRRAAGLTAYRVFRQAAMVIVIGMLLFATAFAAFPEVRIRTLNLIIQVSDVATSLTLEGASGASNNTNRTSDAGPMVADGTLRGYKIPAVPEGFVLVDSKDENTSSGLRYQNGDGAMIIFDIITAEGTTHKVDTEDAEVTSITIHGYEGLLIEKGTQVHITWADTNRVTFISVFCDKIDREQVLAWANEIVYIGSP